MNPALTEGLAGWEVGQLAEDAVAARLVEHGHPESARVDAGVLATTPGCRPLGRRQQTLPVPLPALLVPDLERADVELAPGGRPAVAAGHGAVGTTREERQGLVGVAASLLPVERGDPVAQVLNVSGLRHCVERDVGVVVRRSRFPVAVGWAR